MTLRSLLLLCVLLVGTQAFSPLTHPSVAVKVTAGKEYTRLASTSIDTDTSSSSSFVSRRSAIRLTTSSTFLTLLATTTAAVAASADESSEDLVRRIAAQSASANAAAREKAELEKQKQLEQKNSGNTLVPILLFASVGLSLPFYLPNLLRLGTKIISGGKDDGYGK